MFWKWLCHPVMVVKIKPLGFRHKAQTHVLDLFYCEVCISRHARLLRLDINNDQQRIRRVSLEQLVDLQIRRTQLRPGVIPAYQFFAGVYFFEHVVHVLDVIVVQKPHGGIIVVFFERNWIQANASVRIRWQGRHGAGVDKWCAEPTGKAVGHANNLSIVLTQQHSHNPFCFFGAAFGDSVVVVYDGKQDKRCDGDTPRHKGQGFSRSCGHCGGLVGDGGPAGGRMSQTMPRKRMASTRKAVVMLRLAAFLALEMTRLPSKLQGCFLMGHSVQDVADWSACG